MEKIKILGIEIDRVDMKLALEESIKKIEKKEKFFVVTPNPEIILNAGKDDELFNLINSADMLIPDGIGVVIASKIVGNPLKERVTGIDLMLEIMDYASKNNKKVFLLGGKEGVAEKAKENLEKKYKNLDIVGTHHGYYKGLHSGYIDHEEEKSIVEDINSLSPDILFVCMGSPSQEYFISKYINDINASFFMGAGGSLDVISGNVKRAPEFYQKHGLEWLYRLIKEPSRIGRMMKLPIFALKVLFKKDKR